MEDNHVSFIRLILSFSPPYAVTNRNMHLISAWHSPLFCPAGHATLSDNAFPEYDCLRSNVDFWVKIYTRYPSTTGVIHDRDDLDLIYGSIDLLPQEAPHARKINRLRSKKASERYAALLNRLARGAPPQNAKEKKILALFGQKPSARRLREASENVRIQRGQKDRFVEGLIRSGRYLEKIKKIFRHYGLPPDLAYLPHVESSFNYEAYSKFGAAGIWQFTRDTGKRYLTIDYAVDERRDPIRATEAAAQYLKENYALLGSWPLAITAYNHGEAGMKRAKAEKGTYVRIFEEYEKGYFKFASRNFYSEFLAARKVARNYQHYFGRLAIEKPQQASSLVLHGFLPVAKALSLFKIKEETLHQLNPALRPPVFAGQKFIPKGYNLRLPASRQNGTIIANIPASAYQSAQKRSLFYTVDRGDTAGSIAAQQGVKLHELILANNLDRRATIYIGQHLRIPALATRRQEIASTKTAPVAEPPLVILAAGNSKTRGSDPDISTPDTTGPLQNQAPEKSEQTPLTAPQRPTAISATDTDQLAVIRTYDKNGVAVWNHQGCTGGNHWPLRGMAESFRSQNPHRQPGKERQGHPDRSTDGDPAQPGKQIRI